MIILESLNITEGSALEQLAQKCFSQVIQALWLLSVYALQSGLKDKKENQKKLARGAFIAFTAFSLGFALVLWPLVLEKSSVSRNCASHPLRLSFGTYSLSFSKHSPQESNDLSNAYGKTEGTFRGVFWGSYCWVSGLQQCLQLARCKHPAPRQVRRSMWRWVKFEKAGTFLAAVLFLFSKAFWLGVH